MGSVDNSYRTSDQGATTHLSATRHACHGPDSPPAGALTQVSVTVAINYWQNDPATAATLVDLVAEALGPAPRALSDTSP